MDVQWIFPAAPIKAMPSNPRLQAVAGASPWHCTGVPQLCPALANPCNCPKTIGKMIINSSTMTLTYGPMDAYGDAFDAEGAPMRKHKATCLSHLGAHSIGCLETQSKSTCHCRLQTHLSRWPVVTEWTLSCLGTFVTENWIKFGSVLFSNKLLTMIRRPWAVDCSSQASAPKDLEILLKVSMSHYPIWGTQFCFLHGIAHSDLKVAAQWAVGRHAISIDHVLPAAKLNRGWNQHGSCCAVAPEKKCWISSSPVTSPRSLRACSCRGSGTVIKSC